MTDEKPYPFLRCGRKHLHAAHTYVLGNETITKTFQCVGSVSESIPQQIERVKDEILAALSERPLTVVGSVAKKPKRQDWDEVTMPPPMTPEAKRAYLDSLETSYCREVMPHPEHAYYPGIWSEYRCPGIPGTHTPGGAALKHETPFRASFRHVGATTVQRRESFENGYIQGLFEAFSMASQQVLLDEEREGLKTDPAWGAARVMNDLNREISTEKIPEEDSELLARLRSNAHKYSAEGTALEHGMETQTDQNYRAPVCGAVHEDSEDAVPATCTFQKGHSKVATEPDGPRDMDHGNPEKGVFWTEPQSGGVFYQERAGDEPQAYRKCEDTTKHFAHSYTWSGSKYRCGGRDGKYGQREQLIREVLSVEVGTDRARERIASALLEGLEGL